MAKDGYAAMNAANAARESAINQQRRQMLDESIAASSKTAASINAEVINTGKARGKN